VLLGSFLEDRGGAHFPIFPWATFVFFGIGCAGLLQQRAAQMKALPLVLFGSLLSASAYAQFRVGATEHAFLWRTSSSYLLFRLGLVVVLLGLLQRISEHREGTYRRDSWSAVLARRSLIAYVVHSLILYGTPFSPGLNRLGKSLSLIEASAVFALVLAATIWAARLWDRVERTRWISAVAPIEPSPKGELG
jgi:surface polysaccharide O-acyltransferase-like enzyme